MMLALSVLDLPFEAGEHKLDVKDNRMTITPATDALLFHKEVQAVSEEKPSPILVSQHFFRHDVWRQLQHDVVDVHLPLLDELDLTPLLRVVA